MPSGLSENEVVAWGTAIYESAKPAAWRSHVALAAELGRTVPKENLWLLKPMQERMTYPFCVFWHVKAMLDRETAEGRRADWFFWLEDDIIAPPDTYSILRAAADKDERPYVSGLVYARVPPHGPGVAEVTYGSGVRYVTQWVDAPQSGTHLAGMAGMGACVIHRSLFDKIPEPWFSIEPPQTTWSGAGPDSAWSYRLAQIGVPVNVCCDVRLGHVGDGIVVDRSVSEAWL